MTRIPAWTCPSCDEIVATTYCPSCGEQRLGARDLTLGGLLRQAALAIVDIDGRLLRSVRCLVVHPGRLTTAYVQGLRKPYIAPVQLFLVANVLFFAMQSLTGNMIFSTSLIDHLHSQMWSPVAEQLVASRLEGTSQSFADYAPVFDHAVTLNAKSLVFLMVLAFSALLPMSFRRAGQPFITHAVFALHFYAFLLLVLCAALVVVFAAVLAGGAGLRSETFDHVLSLLNLAVCAVYLYLAIGTVYRADGARRLLQVTSLVVGIAGIFLGYRFALLLITLAST
ncbi:MAG TPA: DUF3667 domain-containing protein [Candidatus Binatia bacterium]